MYKNRNVFGTVVSWYISFYASSSQIKRTWTLHFIQTQTQEVIPNSKTFFTEFLKLLIMTKIEKNYNEKHMSG
jgi:hypothetical protein